MLHKGIILFMNSNQHPKRHRVPALLLCSLALLLPQARAADEEFVVRIKDRQFEPKEVTAPAHQRFKIVIKNEGTWPAEFESIEFHREKVVQPGHEVSVFVGPLDPGTFEFFDDFHRDSRGHLVVK